MARRIRDAWLPGLRPAVPAGTGRPQLLLGGLSQDGVAATPPGARGARRGGPAGRLPAGPSPSMSAPAAATGRSATSTAADCSTWMSRVGIGGCCPHCDEPVAVAELVDPAINQS